MTAKQIRPSKKRAYFDPVPRGEARLSSELILIVSEGTETEPRYFKYLLKRWKIQQARVKVVGSDAGTDPLSVVNCAISLGEKGIRGERYDRIWCVIDTDKHATLSAAIDKAKARTDFDLAISCPCFEIWLLLHFPYSAKPYRDCDGTERALRKHLGGKYAKAAFPLDVFYDLTDNAISNARTLRKSNQGSGATNPMTDVDKLVCLLRETKLGTES